MKFQSKLPILTLISVTMYHVSLASEDDTAATANLGWAAVPLNSAEQTDLSQKRKSDGLSKWYEYSRGMGTMGSMGMGGGGYHHRAALEQEHKENDGQQQRDLSVYNKHHKNNYSHGMGGMGMMGSMGVGYHH